MGDAENGNFREGIGEQEMAETSELNREELTK